MPRPTLERSGTGLEEGGPGGPGGPSGTLGLGAFFAVGFFSV